MRCGHILSAAFSIVALVSSAAAAETVEEVTEPEILVTAFFPETNPFNRTFANPSFRTSYPDLSGQSDPSITRKEIINGEKNTLTLTVENKSERNVTLLGVLGSLHEPDTDALIKNLTALNYGLPLLEGVKVNLPYVFHSEFKTGDARLSLWLEHADGDQKYRVSAYDSIVTIVEPEISWLDWKMWSTYLVVAGLLGGLSYFAYLTFAPQPKKRTKKATPAVSVSGGTATATGASGYQEEWIPEHHLRKGKKVKQTGATSGTSGDELSGAEASGAEGRKRKGRK